MSINNILNNSKIIQICARHLHVFNRLLPKAQHCCLTTFHNNSSEVKNQHFCHLPDKLQDNQEDHGSNL
jgi:hypothetical protein